VYLAVPALIRGLMDFIGDVPTYYQNVMAFINQYTKPGGLLENLDVSATVEELYAFVLDYFTVDRIASYLQSVLNITSSIVDAILAIIVSVYMLLGRESLFRAVRALCSIGLNEKTLSFLSDYMHKIAKIFYNYVYSQLIDALVVSVLATIGLLLVGLPNAPALGIMLGLMNMIPYFGAIIGGVICVLITLLSGNFYGAIFVGVYILVMQQIDGNILQPRIIGHNVGLKAIYVLLGITVGGGLFGFWGILLGAPVMAVIQMILTEYIAYRNREKALAAPPENAPPTE
jgi:predicted PurR-regulated permease PerM